MSLPKGVYSKDDFGKLKKQRLKSYKTLVRETDPRTPMGPADQAPFGSAGGGDRTKSRSRRSTRAVYPASELSGEITLLLLLVWLYYVLARGS